MDLNELKKLINEEVQKIKQKDLLKEQEKEPEITGASTPKAKEERKPHTLSELQILLRSLKQKVDAIALDRNKINYLKYKSSITSDYIYVLFNILKQIESNPTEEIVLDIISNSNFSIPTEVGREKPGLYDQLFEISREINKIKDEYSTTNYLEPSQMETDIATLNRQSKQVQANRKLAREPTVVNPNARTKITTNQ